MASFGIDFGTTNTSVVECLITKHGITKTPYGENNQPFPSLVALHPDKEPMFAWTVKKKRNQLLHEGYTIVSSFKSILGTEESVKVGKKAYSPVDVTALFLSYVRVRVQEMAGADMQEAVVSIPVDFTPEQRRQLRKAAGKAGIRVKSFVSEPTAAYVNCRSELTGASNVAVFDWGGGTLDISFISVDRDIVSEMAVSGTRLGGNDIDMMMARHVHARVAQEQGLSCSFDDLSPADRDQILDRSETAKKTLSEAENAPFRLMHYAGKTMVRTSVSLDEFEKLIRTRIDEAVLLMHHTAEKAGMGLGQLDAVLMVGGSCEMQPIYRRMQALCSEYRLQICRPDAIQWAVAGGAAILSARNPAYHLQDAFGVVLSDDSFFPVFQAGDVVPCQGQELRFGVVEDTTTAVFVFADGRGHVLKRMSVPIKGFTPEGIHLRCDVDDDMILNIHLFSDYAERMEVTGQIHQLGFNYQIQ